MSAVGKPGREGWLDEPNCQSCHDRASSSSTPFVRYTSVFSSGTTVRATVDTRFATNANTPAAGKSLYRFSTGHGGLQCEACHGPTHAEYPSSHDNDNVQSLALQGHTGTINECKVCHTTMPTTANGGPHGMHEVGQAWVQDHHGKAVSRTDCQQCHGTTSAGSPLAVVRTAVTLNAGNLGTKSFAAGAKVTCWSCHNGPNP
jgi:cytochrome c5